MSAQINIIVQIVQFFLHFKHCFDSLAYIFGALGVNTLLEYCDYKSIAAHASHLLEPLEGIRKVVQSSETQDNIYRVVFEWQAFSSSMNNI